MLNVLNVTLGILWVLFPLFGAISKIQRDNFDATDFVIVLLLLSTGVTLLTNVGV